MTKTTETKRYNGYANYETWAVALWLDNDEGLYCERQERVQAIFDDADVDDDQRTTVYNVADMLKGWLDEMVPELGATLWSDLMSAALSEVDWHELAEHWLEEVDKPEPEGDAEAS